MGTHRIHHLASPQEVAAAARHLLAGVEATPLTAPVRAERGFMVEIDGVPSLVAGVRRETYRIGPVGRIYGLVVCPLLTAPARAAPSPTPSGAAAVEAALRELFLGGSHWHVLRLPGAPAPVVDACWRFAPRLGYACVVTQQPPPVRTPAGEILETPPTLAVYAPSLKGRWARALDAGPFSGVGAAARERIAALVDRRRGAIRGTDDEVGSRFFTLELTSVPAPPTWGPEITFREVAAEEAREQPLRYGTGIRRVEQALHRGDRCFATLVGGELAHHHWVSIDPAFLRRVLPDHLRARRVAYPFDAYTYPAFRGRGLQAATHAWLARQYRAQGIDCFAVRISAFNTASIRGVLKAGYVEVPPAGWRLPDAAHP